MKLVKERIIVVLATIMLFVAVVLQVEASYSSGESGGRGRVLGQGRMTCNKYPRVCHTKGSAGPDCCKSKCVNVKTDKLDCGMCGYKCAHHETCCSGRCVDLMRDHKHCGACANKCNRGDVCYYGICSYA